MYNHPPQSVRVEKSGYLYVFVSNETPNIDVFFDNLQLSHAHGPLLEETHYYPFGLTMQGISSKALSFGDPVNKRKFIRQEYDDDLGWDTYQFRYRTHDPQLGRFLQIDPLADKYVYNSTYAYAENKPINGIDIEGLEFWPMFEGLLENNSVISRGPLVETATKTSEVAGKASDATGKAQEGHHVIPQQLKGDPVVESARDGGFKFEGQENKMQLDKFEKATGEGQHGNHPNYNTEVAKRLADFKEKNPNATPEQAAEFLRNTVKDLKETINNNPGTKLNDLFRATLPPAATDNTGKKPIVIPQPPQPKPKEEKKPPPCNGCV